MISSGFTTFLSDLLILAVICATGSPVAVSVALPSSSTVTSSTGTSERSARW